MVWLWAAACAGIIVLESSKETVMLSAGLTTRNQRLFQLTPSCLTPFICIHLKTAVMLDTRSCCFDNEPSIGGVHSAVLPFIYGKAELYTSNMFPLRLDSLRQRQPSLDMDIRCGHALAPLDP